MGRYQDLINTLITDEMTMLIHGLQSQDMQMIDSTMQNLNVLNMLNTKYFIINPNGAPMVNDQAMGNAWFANDVVEVVNADDEIAQLARINIREQVTVDQRFSS